MKKVKVTLENSCHGTEAIVLMPAGTTPDEAWEELQNLAHIAESAGLGANNKDIKRYNRVAKQLCGLECACGTYRP